MRQHNLHGTAQDIYKIQDGCDHFVLLAHSYARGPTTAERHQILKEVEPVGERF